MIIPAILEKDFEEISKKIEDSKVFANRIHIDFIDGKFADNKSFIDDLEKFGKYSDTVDLEAHLMVDEPIDYLDNLSSVGFKRFVGHIEKMNDQVKFVVKGEELGAVGLAIDLDTNIDQVKVSLEDLDQILLMSVKAGFSGQKFDKKVLKKIKTLREKYFGEIEIDGGVNSETLTLAKEAGATSFCVTSSLFREKPKVEFDKLSKLL